MDKFDLDSQELYAIEIEKGTDAARLLVEQFVQLLEADSGDALRPESELPSSRERIKSAIVVVASVSDSAPNVRELGQLLAASWCSLAFFEPQDEIESQEVSGLLAAKLPYRLELAGNESAREVLLEQFANAPDPSAETREQAIAWMAGVRAEYRDSLSSVTSRMRSIQEFVEGRVPPEFFDELARSSTSIAPDSSPSRGRVAAKRSGCAVLPFLVLVGWAVLGLVL